MASITLLTGGSTPERDVALAGAAQVAPALRGLGHAVTVVDTDAHINDPELAVRAAELLHDLIETRKGQ